MIETDHSRCPVNCNVAKTLRDHPSIFTQLNEAVAKNTPIPMILGTLDNLLPNHGISYDSIYRHRKHVFDRVEPTKSQDVTGTREAFHIIQRIMPAVKKVQTVEEINYHIGVLKAEVEHLRAISPESRTAFQSTQLLKALGELRLWLQLCENVTMVEELTPTITENWVDQKIAELRKKRGEQDGQSK